LLLLLLLGHAASTQPQFHAGHVFHVYVTSLLVQECCFLLAPLLYLPFKLCLLPLKLHLMLLCLLELLLLYELILHDVLLLV
jgi:hypothetical protein